jgi:gliding motility-associated-like protein
LNETKIILNKGDGLPLFLPVPLGDTTLSVGVSDYMYQAVNGTLCFRAVLYESENPYGSNGTATSNSGCFEIAELINVPNLFTPDGNLVNDLFRPVLSFTPLSYELVITDTGRHILFKSNDPLEAWDGKNNGSPLPEGVYLWILKIRTTSGRVISRSGNVTLMMNR